jgi:probable F420-dependent oxidoreductase
MSFELGVHLGNAHPTATAAAVADAALAAEQLGFDAVWMTEHAIVGPEAAQTYGTVVHPLPMLAYLAARTERVALGTSVLIAPLHNPVMLAKLAAGIQDLSGGRLRLGLGIGWHRDGFAFMGVPFAGRARRTEESIAVMRSLWAGERSFAGEDWQFHDATFAPLPATPPEIWIGGGSPAAVRRATDLGDAWHPILLTADDIRRVREQRPDLRVVPRVTAGSAAELAPLVAEMHAAGADGVAAGVTGGPQRTLAELPLLAERVRDLR